MNKWIGFLLVVFIPAFLRAQYSPTNGVASPAHTVIAFTHAHILTPSADIESGTVLIQDGEIIGVGTDVTIPFHAVIYDLKGKYIIPSFIELMSSYGQPEPAPLTRNKTKVYGGNGNQAYYWNEAIHPHVDAASTFTLNNTASKRLKKNGFGVVISHSQNGIMQGNGALVQLTDDYHSLISPVPAQFMSFNKGKSPQLYPTSLMGAIALIRQTMYDAQHYAHQSIPFNYDLAALQNLSQKPVIFEARNYLNVARAAAVAEEFNLSIIALSGGDDYKRIEDITALQTPLILPLDFPKPYDVSNPLDAQYISTAALKHWELAPYNPAIVAQANIPFALTATANQKDFWPNLRSAVRHGLPWQEALKALTSTPAEMMGIHGQYGDLVAGKKAHFFITEVNPFLHATPILEHWVNGIPFIYKSTRVASPEGVYNLNVDGALFSFEIKSNNKGYVYTTNLGESKTEPQTGKVLIDHQIIKFTMHQGTPKIPGPIQFVGKPNFKGKIIDGKAQDKNGNWLDWTAIAQPQKNKPIPSDSLPLPGKVPTIFYPNMSYGDTSLPVAQNYYFKDVTIWTCDSNGKYIGDVIVENGKITQMARHLENPGYSIISGKHYHLTPGLIDEHSHIATSHSVNEFGQNNSAEVQIGHIINPDDINIYRQLAGGVTTSQILHGSANPIGGQSAIIQLKWGQNASEMKFKNAPLFIKFALGENVKQSNFNVGYNQRFPRTRLGVEQVYMDAFVRAKAYQEAQLNFANSSKKERKNGTVSPAIDLELEALVQILNNERYITCHSYIQSEILMLMAVADSMGFKVNTFTHILEGYKIADELKAHGAYASTFADWWAYKYEVNDAIPYNAALLTQAGVITAINSDDAEMGRRLNQEAAKTMKYGGLSETQALNTVTINPAKMLHIDHLVGSIAIGKQADLVLWSGNPLDVQSHPVLTLIAGTPYYSLDRHQQLQARTIAERQRIIQKMMEAKAQGVSTQPIVVRQWHQQHCDTFESDF